MQKKILILSFIIENNDKEFMIVQFIDSISDLSDKLQNIWWILGVFFSVSLFVYIFFSFRRKVNKYTFEQIDKLIQNGKYIPGLFVELNETKEVLRYFIYGKRWKTRIINAYNYIYNNVYGNILKHACIDDKVCFQLKKTDKLEKVQQVVNSAHELHTKFRQGKCELKPDYDQSKYLFEVVSYPYLEALEPLQKYCKALNNRYLIITGSAGNGKTNLLCNICELLMKLNETVIFLNARDLKENIIEYMFKELRLPDIYIRHQSMYLSLTNMWLKIQCKRLFIVIDAVNENENKEFENQLSVFINEILIYKQVRVIVSCRNEYYEERFRKELIDKVSMPAFEYDVKTQQYTEVAIKKMIGAYKKCFNYSGFISPAVQKTLSEQLLLMRIFFEVNKDNNSDTYTILKHEVFDQYIETVKIDGCDNIKELLDVIADLMLESNNYNDINLQKLKENGVNLNFVEMIADSSVLIGKKLISHEGTIAREETEVVYFVFDELRDYYLARRILLSNIHEDFVCGEAIIEKLRELRKIDAPCEEGVFHYVYVFFKTDKVVLETGASEELCNSILDFYRKPNEQRNSTYWRHGHREEFYNLGMRIILTSGLPIEDFEMDYIRDCLTQDPYEDGGILFDTLLNGTLYNGANNIETYIDILFGIADKDAMLAALREITSRDALSSQFEPENFIMLHKEYTTSEINKAMQIQKIAELFLCCFRLNNAKSQNRLEEYFYNLSNHKMIQREMVLKLQKTYLRGKADENSNVL